MNDDVTIPPSLPRGAVDIDDYKSEFATNLSEAWKLARSNIEQAQTRQKKQYDKRAREVDLREGDQVMVYARCSSR